MFSWKKKKQATAVPNSTTTVVANGKPEGHPKKRKGSGSLSQISKLFGSQNDGLNKAGVESPSGRKPGLLKSTKKKQAPLPPTTPNAPQIVVTDERDGHSKPGKDKSFHDNVTSPTDVSSITTSSESSSYPASNDSRFSNGTYHNGSVGTRELQNTSNPSLYSASAVSTNSSSVSGSDVRNDSALDLTSPGDAALREYAVRPIEKWEEVDVLEWLEDIGLDYFVDMFQDCGIDGEYILSVTEEDLVELEVDDAELRLSLLTAISEAARGNLPKKTVIDTSSNDERFSDGTHEDSADTRKRVDSAADSQDLSDLEFSDPELPDDGDLQKTNHNLLTPSSLDGDDESLKSFNVDEDDSEDLVSRGENEDSELEKFNREIKDRENLTDNHLEDADDMSLLVETPVEAWGEPQVLLWLSAIGLDHLRSHFRGHNLTGNELLNIDMQFLDEMQLTSKEDRELLLSHLYQLNNPAANIPQNDTISAINQSSGYERQKFMAAVTVLQSGPDGAVQLLPPDNTPAMEALVENPASPEGGSRGTSPRSPEGSRHTSPEGSRHTSPEGSKHSSPTRHTSPRSNEERQNGSPRSQEGSRQSSPRSAYDSKPTNNVTVSENSRMQVSPSREIKLKSNPSSGSEGGKRSDGEDRKKKATSGLMKLVGAISPKTSREPQKGGETTVQVWTTVGSQGPLSSLSIKLKNDSSTKDLIKQCLAKLQLTEDFRLYSIVEIFPSTTNDVEDRELEMDENPVEVQYMWPDHASCRLELRQRQAQGGAVKVVFHLAGQKPKGKLLSISLSTPASEVIAFGLRKFGMPNSDPSLFCLLEVDKFGDLHDVDDETIPLQLDSHAFVLCDRNSKDTAAATQSEEETSNDPADVRRNDSMNSRASSRISFSGASVTSSHGSSSDLLSSRIDDEKLSKLEEELTVPSQNDMASIAEALSPGMESVDDPDGATSLRQGGQLEKTILGQDSMDKDKVLKAQVEKQANTIKALRQQNQRLEKKAKQLLVVQAALSRLENTYRHEIAECHKRVSVPCESESLPGSVVELQQKLDTANQDIVSKQKSIEKLKQEQQKQDDMAQDNLDSNIMAAELDYKLALEETSLVALQQDQARLFSRLELALADHQVAIEKGRSRKYRRPLFPILNPSSMHQETIILPLQINLALESQTLMLAGNKDQGGVVIERCRAQSSLKVGDRLIEVNGENVTRADIAEVNSCLNKSAKAQVVILREQPVKPADTANLAKVKQQLSLANQQLESSRRENSRLKEEVRRLRPLENHVVETTQMKASIHQFQNELAASQNRCEQLALELVAAQRTPHDKSYRETQREKERLEEEVDELKDTIFRLQESMEAKDSKLASVIHERDAALERLREIDDSKPKKSAMIMNNDDDLPLWESLKSANKSEILGVLQEEVEEAGRQKNYLDQLYTVMLEKAPQLLNDLEEECEISEFSDNEEFC